MVRTSQRPRSAPTALWVFHACVFPPRRAPFTPRLSPVRQLSVHEFLSSKLRALFDVTVDDFMTSLAKCCENVVVGTIVLDTFRVAQEGPVRLELYATAERWAGSVVDASRSPGRRRDLDRLLALAPQGLSVGWLLRASRCGSLRAQTRPVRMSAHADAPRALPSPPSPVQL
jgi:hypothetical protein